VEIFVVKVVVGKVTRIRVFFVAADHPIAPMSLSDTSTCYYWVLYGGHTEEVI
jgi:hypothetical protein